MTRVSALDVQRAAAMDGLSVPALPPRRRKSGVRVVAGTEARDHGQRFEAWLRSQHELAEREGIAHVRHVGPPVAHTGPGGSRLVVVGHGPADYQGTLAGGRSVAVEAKSRDRRLSRAEIPEHQQADLTRVAELGGLALLVIELREHGAVYAIEWGRVPWTVRSRKMQRHGVEVIERSESVGAEELEAWHVAGYCYLTRWA